VNRAGAIAEEQGHHPDILLAWGKAEVTIYTHKINGLTESDFVLAAKIDRVQ
jgi:4a-hydroxytetrahydrobiopterin dehydratase